MKVGKKKIRILLYYWLPTRTCHKNLVIWRKKMKSGEFGPFFPWKIFYISRNHIKFGKICKKHKEVPNHLLAISSLNYWCNCFDLPWHPSKILFLHLNYIEKRFFNHLAYIISKHLYLFDQTIWPSNILHFMIQNLTSFTSVF
jgi:hypothetical protein